MTRRRHGQSLIAVLIITFVISVLVSTVVSALRVWDARNDMYQDDLQDRADSMTVTLVSQD